MTDPWALDVDERDTPPEPADDSPGSEVEVGPLELSAPVHCPNCGQWHSTCRARSVEMLRSQIRAEARDRMERTETVLGQMNEAERVSVASWLQSVLERPPFANGHTPAPFDRVAALLDAVWRDIYWLTPADDDPAVPGGNAQLLAQRPGRYIAP